MSKTTNENCKILAIIRDFFVIGTCVIIWAYWIATNDIHIKLQIKDKDFIEQQTDSLTLESNSYES